MSNKTDAGVKIRLFRDENRYADDLFVCVNGKSYLIRRGVEVTVPAAVAEVIAASQTQDAETASEMLRKGREG